MQCSSAAGTASDVFAAILAARLPISLSDAPDFSTVVDGEGRSRPRR